MAYQALYRAYRPQKFSEVVGQKNIITTLQNAIKLNKVAHAYLFCGPRGTGKTSLAKILAKALNCENGPSIEPCCSCSVCEGITKGVIADVVEIDAASNTSVDDIRILRDTVKYLPTVAKYKVYIIDEVHMLSNAAFNALLKTLEEPPHYVIFILATTEPYKLPNTILSRCQRFDFQSISTDDILKRLKIVANEENIKIDDAALNQIATAAEGGMRDALSLFDQCISYSTGESITLNDVLNVSGNISYTKMIELLSNCVDENETNAVIILDSILKEGKEVPKVINDLILFLRDVLLYKNNSILDRKMMFDDENFKSFANKISKAIIYKWLDILNDSSTQMRFSTQKRAFLELAILKMNDNELNNIANLSNRVESLEMAISNLLAKEQEKPKVEQNYVFSTPAPELMKHYEEKSYAEPEVEQPVEPVVEAPKPVEMPKAEIKVSEPAGEYVTVKDVENILNNASKENRNKLNRVWDKISEKYANNFAIQILTNGKIIAASSDSFIVELQDVGFCNRVMSYENYQKIIEIFNDLNIDIKDYICLPKQVCAKILADYKKKYDPIDNPKPSLDEFNLGIKKRVSPVNVEVKKDEDEQNLIDLFDNNLKIMEE